MCPFQRTGDVRDPAYQDATGCECRVIERLENLGLGEVFEQVGVRDRRVASPMRGDDGTEVPVPDLGYASYASYAGEYPMFRTDTDALGVKIVGLHQLDELAVPAAKTDDGPGRGRG
jgi:hypothetical protein